MVHKGRDDTVSIEEKLLIHILCQCTNGQYNVLINAVMQLSNHERGGMSGLSPTQKRDSEKMIIE
jgi:hypothetical protein